MPTSRGIIHWTARAAVTLKNDSRVTKIGRKILIISIYKRQCNFSVRLYIPKFGKKKRKGTAMTSRVAQSRSYHWNKTNSTCCVCTRWKIIVKHSLSEICPVLNQKWLRTAVFWFGVESNCTHTKVKFQVTLRFNMVF